MAERGEVGSGNGARQCWAIETEGLTKRFGRLEAVDGLNLHVASGTVYGLIGPNGAGKTTTLRLLAGLIDPTKGQIRLNGHTVASGDGLLRYATGGRGLDAGSFQRQIGYMPDFFGVYEDMRTWEYLDFFARCYDIPAEERDALITELLELVDLIDKRDADVHQLSRGMKQRLCLAHALVHDPEILLLDEPASGLDPRARLEIRELLIELRAMGKTVVISSHILAELAEMCDSVGIMERGRMLASGPVDEIERRLLLGRVIRLRVAGSRARARELLERLSDVEVVGAEGEGSEGDGPGSMEFRLAGDEARQAEILALLTGAGVPVSAYVPRERDLEGLFMRITKGEVA